MPNDRQQMMYPCMAKYFNILWINTHVLKPKMLHSDLCILYSLDYCMKSGCNEGGGNIHNNNNKNRQNKKKKDRNILPAFAEAPKKRVNVWTKQ